MTEQENKLKDLAWEKMKELGIGFQKSIANPMNTVEVNNMNEKAKEGLKKLLIINRMKDVINDINTKKISITTAVKAHSEYEKWVHIQMLVELTNDEELKDWVALKKEQARYKNV